MATLDDYRRLNTRPASVITVGGFRPTKYPLATHFGLHPVALPEESWPEIDGRPLPFVCQLNLTESPFVPEPLHGVALLTLFVTAGQGRLGDTNGDRWILRTYPQLDGLIPLKPPADAISHRGYEAKFVLARDQPVYDDPDIVIPSGGFDASDVELDNIRRSKLGGYPSNIQSEQWWTFRHPPDNPHPSRPRYCFQIDSEPKVGLQWGDGGTAYFARGTAPGCDSHWFLDWQCY